jgi:hypothetical protein
LHEESTGDLSASVQTVVLGRNLSGTDCVFHTSSGSHGVFSADTNAIEEESPDVADNPAVEGGTPCGGEHEQTDEHDDSILDETMATTEPVTEDTNEDLTWTC